MDKSDDSWRGLDRWQRLVWARRHRGFESATSAAESLGMQPGTYRAYERPPDSSKHSRFDDQAAARFARKFRVRWEWLLVGEGEPWLETGDGGEPTPTDRVVRIMKEAAPERREAIALAIEALVKAV